MSRDFELYLDDILEAVSRIREYLTNVDAQSFAGDRRTQDAVIRNLEVIGEAARQIPEEIRQQAPSIEWRRVCGLRDVLIHKYHGVNLAIIWDVATNDLGELEVQIRKLTG